jgi:hypothetical protein
LQWLKVEFQSVWASHKDNQEAVISYRLGRETMEVESDINRFKVPIVDDLLALLVRLIEFFIVFWAPLDFKLHIGWEDVD